MARPIDQTTSDSLKCTLASDLSPGSPLSKRARAAAILR